MHNRYGACCFHATDTGVEPKEPRAAIGTLLADGRWAAADAFLATLARSEADAPEMVCARADLRLTLGDLVGAAKLVAAALAANPDHSVLAHHAAEIASLRGMATDAEAGAGGPRASLRALSAAIEAGDADGVAHHAATFRRRGSPHDAALAARHAGRFHSIKAGLALISAARTLWPEPAPAALILSELALLEAAGNDADRDPIRRAAAECERQLARCCDAGPTDSHLALRRIDAAILAGDAETALMLARAERTRQGPNAALARRFQRARALVAKAAPAPRPAADDSPAAPTTHDWRRRCTALREAGQFAEALQVVDAWRAAMPADHGPQEFRLSLLRLTGDREALAQILDARAPATNAPPSLLIEAARGYRYLARPAPASERLAQALARAPHNARAALDRAAILEGCGMPAGARSVLEQCLEAGRRNDAAPGPPHLQSQMRFGLARLAQAAGDLPAARHALEPLLDTVTTLSDPDLLRLLIACESLGFDEAPQLFDALLERPLEVETGAALIGHVLSRSDVDLARHLAARLIAAQPDDRRAQVAPYLQAVTDGATGALAALRALPRPVSLPDAGTVTRLADLLDTAGYPGTARRLIARALAAKPNHADLRARQIGLLLAGGRIDAARAALDHAATAGLPEDWCRAQKVRILEAAGQAEAAMTELEDLPWRNDTYAMRLAVWAGDLPRAEAAASRLGIAAGPARNDARRSSGTLEGAALNELRILKELRQRGDIQGADELTFHLPAMQRIGAWARSERMADPAAGAPIPARITQYWDRAEMPAEIAAMVESWRRTPGFTHRIHDREGAAAMIAGTFGTDHLRAFRLANHVVEEADYFRLCALVAEGGIYADADDRRLLCIERLLGPARGALFMREPSGAIANNFIAAAPGHPVLVSALDDVTRSLLARDNSPAWFKTGPGPLTRALARHLSQETDGSTHAVTLRDAAEVAPFIAFHRPVAYKGSAAYWNASARAYPPEVRAMIESCLTAQNPATSKENPSGAALTEPRPPLTTARRNREAIPANGPDRPASTSTWQHGRSRADQPDWPAGRRYAR